MMPFKGFNIVYPSYTVICPQTGFTYDVRSLNVSEVSKLKTSLVTPSKATELVNRSIFDALNSKPEFIKMFEDFKKCTTLKDREALLYGLHQATFGDLRDLSVTCRHCENEQVISISLGKSFKFEAYPGSESIINSYKVAKTIDNAMDPDIEKVMRDEERRKIIEARSRIVGGGDENDGIIVGKKQEEIKYADEPSKSIIPPVVKKEEKLPNPNQPNYSILNKRLNIELPISKIVATIKQPTIDDEEKIFGSLSMTQKKHNELLYETLIIEKFEQFTPGNPIPVISISSRDDILYGYQSLPPMDKKRMQKEFQENFGIYGIDLNTNYNCGNCGESNNINLDIIIQFFRSIGES